jgi:hypothetical protein
MSKLLPMLDPFDEIKRLYFTTTRQTIERDMGRALDLLTHMPTDEDRQRVAGYMHGLAELRRDWKTAPKPSTPKASTSEPASSKPASSKNPKHRPRGGSA